MTSINAIKFNFHQGAMVCDEQRGWNKENMVIFTADKMKPVTTPEIEAKYRFAASYGNTGSSSIGDELKHKIKQAVLKAHQEKMKQSGGSATHLMTVEELAMKAFDIQIAMKHKHIDEYLLGRYGFTTAEFISGKFTNEGKEFAIQDDEVISAVMKEITWQGRSGDSTPVFLNAGIIAGYEPQEGFQIFHLSLIEHLCEPVQELFLNDGSGRDMSMVHMTEYSNNLAPNERQGDIDPAEGLYQLINAVNAATRFNIGVGGYFNIITIDGKADDPANIRREIHDYRAKLAAHIASAGFYNLIDRVAAIDLVGELLLNDGSFEEVLSTLVSRCRNRTALSRMMRGYKSSDFDR